MQPWKVDPEYGCQDRKDFLAGLADLGSRGPPWWTFRDYQICAQMECEGKIIEETTPSPPASLVLTGNHAHSEWWFWRLETFRAQVLVFWNNAWAEKVTRTYFGNIYFLFRFFLSF